MRILQTMNLLDAEGRLQPLDSLGIVDLVVELEAELSVRIPTTQLRAHIFRDIDSVVDMIAAL